jgi:hypothetical protein
MMGAWCYFGVLVGVFAFCGYVYWDLRRPR